MRCTICNLPASATIDYYGSWINVCDRCASEQAKLKIENIVIIESNLECRRRNYDERQQRGGVR